MKNQLKTLDAMYPTFCEECKECEAEIFVKNAMHCRIKKGGQGASNTAEEQTLTSQYSVAIRLNGASDLPHQRTEVDWRK